MAGRNRYVTFDLGAKLTFTISLKLSDSNKLEFFDMSLMLVDSSQAKKRKRSGPSSSSSSGSGVPVRLIGPRMRSGNFRSGGRGARDIGFRSGNETGYVDLAAATHVMDTTGDIDLMATVGQGVTVNTRVGKKIIWKSVQCHGVIVNNATATDNAVSLLVVYDKRPTDALPTITQILDTANALSFNKDENSSRFQVLKRIDEELTGSAANQITDFAKRIDFFLNLRGLPCEFMAAGTGAIGDISTGALYLITVGTSAAGTTAAIFNGGFRIRFQDV